MSNPAANLFQGSLQPQQILFYKISSISQQSGLHVRSSPT